MSAPRASKTSPARNLEKLATRLRGRRIGVVGDLMLDRYVWGSANRLSPEAAVPVVDFVSETSCLGGAGNVAANLAALGASVTPFGVTGADEAARDLRRCLTALGMPSKGVIADAQRSTRSRPASSRAISKSCASIASAVSPYGRKPKSASCAPCSPR